MSGVRLDEIVDITLLAEMIAEGYVRVHEPLDGPPHLRLYNYTEKTQYEGVWNGVTRICRGLIVEGDRVLARPFAKFFNLDQHPPGSLPSGPVEVADKIDGSLGILYRRPDGPAIATRGSFDGLQARRGTRILRQRYLDASRNVPEGITLLFEIIYPENRIVVDYGALDDLILLGALDNRTGRSVPTPTWPGRLVEHRGRFASLDEAMPLLREPVPNHEGYVIRFLETDFRIKYKHDDYLRLHRLLTGVTPQRIWELLRNGAEDDLLRESVPDEFHAWLREQVAHFRSRFDAIEAECRRCLDDPRARVETRKQIAEYFKTCRYPGILFAMLDDKGDRQRWRDAIWKQVRPDRGRAFRCDDDV